MKFCKDCKWYLPTSSEHWERCTNKLNCTKKDLVSGRVIDSYTPSFLRASIKLCGPTAKWYEEKEKPIPKCEECKFSNVPYWKCSKNVAGLLHNRLNESLCGKYGKWWEKKEVPVGAIIEYQFVPAPKKQSWLCRLICGWKK